MKLLRLVLLMTICLSPVFSRAAADNRFVRIAGRDTLMERFDKAQLGNFAKRTSLVDKVAEKDMFVPSLDMEIEFSLLEYQKDLEKGMPLLVAANTLKATRDRTPVIKAILMGNK